MIQITKISSRGQITIPAKLRALFSLQEDSRVLVLPKIDADEIVIRPLGQRDLSSLRGSIKPKHKPEDWTAVGKKVQKEVARKVVGR